MSGGNPDFMGNTDNARRAWLNNFATVCEANAGALFLAAADVDVIVSNAAQFNAAMTVVETVGMRNTVTIAQKNAVKSSSSAVCRQYAAMMRSKAGIDPDLLILAGVRPPGAARTTINVPTPGPVLVITAATKTAHTIEFRSSVDLNVRAKPTGAIALQLHRVIAPAPVEDFNAALLYGTFTKNPMLVTFNPGDNGKSATYFARWVSRRGQVSNWSTGVSMTIAA